MSAEVGLRPVRRWPWTLAVLIVAAAHFVMLLHFFAPAISTPDANGYFAQATRIANDHRSYFTLESPLEWIGQHWLTPDGKTFFSRYPPGYAAILAVPFKLGGPAAAMLVPAVMASLTLLGVYLLVARWVGPGWGFLAAALMAFNPTANEHALYQFAHPPVAFFLVWGLWFLTRWEDAVSSAVPNSESKISRTPAGRPWRNALFAGICFGVLPSVRYPAALYLAAAGIFVALVVIKRRAAWRSALVGGVAALMPVIWLAARNQLAFGAFWKTGYALTNEQTGFGLDYFARSWLNYIVNLQGEGAGVLFGLGLAGVAAMTFRRDTWRRGVMLLLMLAPITLVYMAYYWGNGGGQAMRFLIPTFYLYALGGVWLLSRLRQLSRPATVAAACSLLLITVAWGLPPTLQRLARQRDDSQALAEITTSLERNVPRGSLVIAAEGIQQQLDFAGDWKLVDESLLRSQRRRRFGGPMMRRNDDDNRPSPMQAEKMEVRAELYEGLTGAQRTAAVCRDLRKWAGDRKVYWVVRKEQAEQLTSNAGRTWPGHFTRVAGIVIPAPAEESRSRRGGRMGPGGPGGGPGGFGGPGGPGGFGGFGPPAGGFGGPAGQFAGPGGFGRARDDQGLGGANPRLGRLRRNRRGAGGPGGFDGPGGPGGPGGMGGIARGGTWVILQWTLPAPAAKTPAP